jgi:hypothetical protein
MGGVAMSGLKSLKELIRPPFANYDVVVYFGCGLFVLPFARHYLWQGGQLPVDFDFKLTPEIANIIVTVLVALFSVYIIGHIIAYVASITIEKGVDFFFGKTSTVVLASAEKGTENSTFRDLLKEGVRKAFKRSTWAAGVFRAAVHVPAYPAYAIIYGFGIFGYYRSRVPGSVIKLARTKFTSIGLAESGLSASEKWYKPLEASVINNHPGASARMYNYLVISGLFRSISLIFLVSLWFELFYLVSHWVGRSPPDGLLMFGRRNGWGQLMSYSGVSLVYVFCLFSYLKFQRRYVEEAIFAFVFAD